MVTQLRDAILDLLNPEYNVPEPPMLIHVPCTTCDVIIFNSQRQVCQLHVTDAG